MSQRFESWSATRLSDYEQCPKLSQHKHLLKTCPSCFKGKVVGGYDTLAQCQACKTVIKKAPALERGIVIGKNLEDYVNGQAPRLHSEIKNSEVKAIAKKLRATHKKTAEVKTELMINFARGWKVLPPSWSPEIWFIAKLDVFRVGGSFGYVIDWKTGGLDKSTGGIRQGSGEKYEGQLSGYNVAALSAFPNLEAVESMLVFVDVAEGQPATFTGPGLTRAELPAAQKTWEKRIIPMFSDKSFVATPNFGCRWCDFSKSKGGPCQF